MNKERLEECKNILNYTYDINGVPHHRITTENLKWLIQQAERAEELEKKVERYREAIEWALYESAWCDEGNALAAKVVDILAKALEEQE